MVTWESGNTMPGLGDIVIPGLFIGYCDMTMIEREGKARRISMVGERHKLRCFSQARLT